MHGRKSNINFEGTDNMKCSQKQLEEETKCSGVTQTLQHPASKEK